MCVWGGGTARSEPASLRQQKPDGVQGLAGVMWSGGLLAIFYLCKIYVKDYPKSLWFHIPVGSPKGGVGGVCQLAARSRHREWQGGLAPPSSLRPGCLQEAATPSLCLPYEGSSWWKTAPFSLRQTQLFTFMQHLTYISEMQLWSAQRFSFFSDLPAFVWFKKID